jgi:hypothetical protein
LKEPVAEITRLDFGENHPTRFGENHPTLTGLLSGLWAYALKRKPLLETFRLLSGIYHAACSR